MRLRLPSLELSFLPLSLRKGLSVPEIIVCGTEAVGGYRGMYYRASEASAGRIVVAEYPECFEATLAHEWRHHWQWMNQRFVGDWDNPIPAFGCNYWDDIVGYFSRNAHEFDALSFQFGIGSIDPLCEEWLIRCERAGRGYFS